MYRAQPWSALTLTSYVAQDETTHPTSRAKKLTIPYEDLLDGPTVLKSDDANLVDYIRKHFILKPEHYEASLERRVQKKEETCHFNHPLANFTQISLDTKLRRSE